MDTDRKDFFKLYPKYVIELFIIMIIICAISDKSIDLYFIIKNSLVIGLLIYVIEYMNDDFRVNIRQGMHYSISSLMFTQLLI